MVEDEVAKSQPDVHAAANKVWSMFTAKGPVELREMLIARELSAHTKANQVEVLLLALTLAAADVLAGGAK